jgi:hypothetical protein
MFCSECGNRLSATAKFCAACGARVELPVRDDHLPRSASAESVIQSPSLTPSAPPDDVAMDLVPVATETFTALADETPSRQSNSSPKLAYVDQIRPWTRWASRLIDIFTFTFVLAILAELVSPGALASQDADRAFSLLCIFLWIVPEALLLSTTGSTLGRRLLRIRVVRADDSRLDLISALKRGFKVWLSGMAIGFPLFSLFTMIRSYNELTKNRKCRWDESLGTEVRHEDISVFRGVIAVSVLTTFFALMVWGSLPVA